MEELGVEMVEKGKRRKGKRDGRTEYDMGVEKKKNKTKENEEQAF